MFKKVLVSVLLCVASIGFALAAVNINTASVEQLESLPNIGPAKAKAIVEYRKTHGDFKALEDIKNVKGIGDRVFTKIKADIALSGETTVQPKEPKADKKTARKAKKEEMAGKPVADEATKPTRQEKAAARKAARSAASQPQAAQSAVK